MDTAVITKRHNLPAFDAATCQNCGQPGRDIMTTTDPRNGATLLDLCRRCATALTRTAEITRALRSDLEDAAEAWARGDDEYGEVSRLLRETGLPLDDRWAAFKDLVAMVAFRQDVGIGAVTVHETDLSHVDELDEVAERQVVDALKALVGGAR